MADYAKQDVLVDTEWVAQHGQDENVRLLEVDVDTTAYDQGHIEGAVGINWKSQLQDGVRRDLTSKADFEKLMSESGVGNDTTVVVYGDNNNWFATWAYWQLKYNGHKDARVMNGGTRQVACRGQADHNGCAQPCRRQLHGRGTGLFHSRSTRLHYEQSIQPGACRREVSRRIQRRAACAGALAPGRRSARRPHPRRGQRTLGNRRS